MRFIARKISTGDRLVHAPALRCAATGLALCAALLSFSASAQQSTAEPVDMGEVMALLRQQQAELAAQRELLNTQSQQIDKLNRELQVLRTPAPLVANARSTPTRVADSEPATAMPAATAPSSIPEQAPPSATTAMTSTTAVTTAPGATAGPEATAATTLAAGPPTQAETETGEQTRKAASKAVTLAQSDDPTRALLEDFKGAWRLPGTNAALGIAGYVKTAVVYNFEPLDIKDRFIVGSIPVGISTDGIKAQSSITADQSRLNFDLREATEFGMLRAFIEGDFASDNSAFRLRHAFGQWRELLAGQTWSTFVDTEASPEEVDFEGLNGRVNVRQSQLRFMPRLGQEYEFQFSLEDPNPQIQNGTGVTRSPDMVLSGRFQPRERLHVKLGLIGRQIRAQQETGTLNGVETQFGWGVTLSGRYSTPRFDNRDKLLFQLNAGNGIGRYVNDLSSVGNFDGVINPATGELQLFNVRSGYVSLQHWWGINTLRSNFTLGMVTVDNPGFVEGDAYKQTLRASTNLFWSPTPRIDVGGELLWGERENEDGGKGDATQVQLALRYRF